MKAYPNPVTIGQNFYIKADELTDETVVEVYDIFGRLVDYKRSIDATYHIFSIDAKYSTGIYVFVLKDSDGFRMDKTEYADPPKSDLKFTFFA